MLKFSQNAFRKTHFKLQPEEDRKAHAVIGCVQYKPTRKLEFFYPSRGYLMYRVKAQIKRTAYRSRHSTEEVTRVAHVKATKHKANPATDEVRVENRNHGLA